MKRSVSVVVLVACGLVAGLSGCGSSKPQVTPEPAAVDVRGHERVDITATENQFTPAAIIVDVGTRVTWHNTDSIAHNVEKSADALDFGAEFGADASQFGPGQSYSFTFTKTGTFYYTCTIHTLMSGKVEVVRAS